jgi:hypothetical protein
MRQYNNIFTFHQLFQQIDENAVSDLVEVSVTTKLSSSFNISHLNVTLHPYHWRETLFKEGKACPGKILQELTRRPT